MAKQKQNTSTTCPCGSGAHFNTCCKPYLTGEKFAPNALTLMRSRYSAFVTENEEYLYDTWVASMRPKGEIIDKKLKTQWVSLKIISHETNEERATVEFIARYKINGRMHQLHELSRFIKENDRWYYFDGTFF